jgi:hypothetical protein
MGITSTEWAVVVASASASILTTIGARWLDGAKAKREAVVARADELKRACMKIISGAFRVSQRAGALRTNMIHRSGLTEGLDVLLHIRKPADPLEICDYLLSELSPVLDAQSVLWLSGDENLMRSAGDVILAKADVIEKSTALPKDRQSDPSASHFEHLKVSLRGFIPLTGGGQEEVLRQESVKNLALACAKFGEVMRENLGVDDAGAILKAFPNLLKSPDDSSDSDGLCFVPANE